MANDGTIKVTGADLDNMAQDMNQATNKIKQRLEDMHQNLMKIYGDGWKGDAQVAYQNAKAQWDKQIDEMHQIMLDAQQNVITSKENYEAGDKKAASFF